MRGWWLLFFALFFIACGEEQTHQPPPPAPKGSLLVSWALTSTDGEALSCADVGAETAEILIGAEPTRVPCVDGSVRFSDLLPGNFPVRVRIKLGAAVLREEGKNALVEENKETQVPFQFEFESNFSADTGSLRIRWLVEGESAAVGCSALGGETVKITTLAGSIDEFTHQEFCENGETVIPDRRAGFYSLLLDLLDENGDRIRAATLSNVRVRAHEQTDGGIVNFANVTFERGKILGLWTVNSSIAEDGCLDVDGSAVTMEIVRAPGQIAPMPVTASCAVGQAEIDGIFDNGDYSVRFTLLYGAGLLNTSTTVHDVEVRRGQTSTIGVDLQPTF